MSQHARLCDESVQAIHEVRIAEQECNDLHKELDRVNRELAGLEVADDHCSACDQFDGCV